MRGKYEGRECERMECEGSVRRGSVRRVPTLEGKHIRLTSCPASPQTASAVPSEAIALGRRWRALLSDHH